MDEFAFSGSKGVSGSRVWRRAMVLGAALALVSSGFASADQLKADADAAVESTPHGNGVIATQAAGTTVAYDLSAQIVNSPPNSGANDNDVFEVDGDCTSAPCAVDVAIARSGDWLATSPDAGAPASFVFTSYEAPQDGTIRVTVPAGTPCGTSKTMTATLTAVAANGRALNPNQLNLSYVISTAACEEGGNTAPTVTADTDPVTVDEGDLASNTGTYEDADDDDVTLTASVGDLTDNEDGTWSWSLATTDGPAEQTVTITANDGTDTGSVDFGLTVDNVAPDVAAPSFSSVSIDCRSSVDLTGISFSDPGVNDADWNVKVDFGDGSADVNYDTATQGAQGDQSHTYDTPGTYTATVDVTDKDGDAGSASSDSVVVNQVYRVDFRPPFDDSTPSGLIVNTMKSGRTVPVKATIFDVCTDSYVTDPAAVRIAVSKANVANGSSYDSVENYADSGSSSAGTDLFRWSADSSVPGGGFWIYNLDSRNAIGGSPMVVGQVYRINIYVGAVLATASDWALLKPVK